MESYLSPTQLQSSPTSLRFCPDTQTSISPYHFQIYTIRITFKLINPKHNIYWSVWLRTYWHSWWVDSANSAGEIPYRQTMLYSRSNWWHFRWTCKVRITLDQAFYRSPFVADHFRHRTPSRQPLQELSASLRTLRQYNAVSNRTMVHHDYHYACKFQR